MECKNQKISCVTRIINTTWEEMRACECGSTCNLIDRQRSGNRV